MPKYQDPYFAKEGLSFHKLKDFQRSPRYYYRKHVQKEIKDEDKASYAFGRAAHCLTLEGAAAYEARFAVAPSEHCTPSGELSDKKETKKWIAEQEMEIIGPKNDKLVHRIAAACHAHPIAGGLIAPGAGAPEVELFGDILGVPCKGKADWIRTAGQDVYIIDLKTCEDIDEFPQHVKDFGYAEQLAFYNALHLSAYPPGALDLRVYHMLLLAAEKGDAGRVGLFRLDPAWQATARHRVMNLIHKFKYCSENDSWPNGYEDIITLSQP
jgi:hypothetical protein